MNVMNGLHNLQAISEASHCSDTQSIKREHAAMCDIITPSYSLSDLIFSLTLCPLAGTENLSRSNGLVEGGHVALREPFVLI